MRKKKGKQMLAVFLALAMCSGYPVLAADFAQDETAAEIFTDEAEIFSSGAVLQEETPDADEKNTGLVCRPENGTIFEPIRPEEFDLDWDDGTAEEMPGRGIHITNRGNRTVTVDISPVENFFVIAEKYDESTGEPEAWAETITLEPGKRLDINLYAKSTEGIFKENVRIHASDGTKLQYTISQECPHVATSADFVKVSTERLDFGEKEIGYPAAPGAKTVTVTNISKEIIRLQHIGESPIFKKGKFSKETLKPGEKASFRIRPRTGLKGNQYRESLYFQISGEKNEKMEYKMDALFHVYPYSPAEIGKIAPIVGIRNGREKTAEGLGLPETVWVILDKDRQTGDYCKVLWDVENCAYDPLQKDEQKFTVNGKVALSDKMENGNHLDLHVAAQVQVDAYEPLKKPIITKVKESENNYLNVSFEANCSGAQGYDVVAAESRKKLKWKDYCFSKMNNTDYGLGYTAFPDVEKGTYYVAMRTYEFRNGKKVYSEWSNPVKAVKTARVVGKAVIKSVKVKGSAVKVTVENCRNSDGYDAVLANHELNGTPYDSVYVVKNKKETTLTFTNVKKGQYYLGVHAYNRDFCVNSKYPKNFGEWSKLQIIRVG